MQQASQTSGQIAAAVVIALSQPVTAFASGADAMFGRSAQSYTRVSAGSIVSGGRRDFYAIPEETIFHCLAKQWRDECGVLSSTTEMVMSSAYQRIIGMGPRAVPMILREVDREKDQPDNWFWALRHITGENPVPPEARGNRPAMAAAWLDWAKGRYAW